MKRYVVLVNLGGPDTQADVRPFLYNLFRDPDLIPIPWWLRWLRVPIAWIIAKFRAPKAAENYKRIGGGSPLRKITEAFAAKLEQQLAASQPAHAWRVRTAMRFWHPLAAEVIADIKQWQPDEILLIPLYPQYSVTTIRSSYKDFLRQYQKSGLRQPVRAMQYWHDTDAYTVCGGTRLAQTVARARAKGQEPIVLYSAHSIPKDRAEAGDPYPLHVQQSIEALHAQAGLSGEPMLGYQSKVGPVEWLGPAVEDEVDRLAALHPASTLIIYPVSFVSDHIETLEEIDIGYREQALEKGFSDFLRVPVFNDDDDFVEAFTTVVHTFADRGQSFRCLARQGEPCACNPARYMG